MRKISFILGVVFSFSLSCAKLSAADTIEEYINGMTLREKVGQLILLGIQGQGFDAKDISYIKKINPGGIIFYGRNLKDADDIPHLISRITALSRKSTLPMFFAVDQEGGLVHRVEGEVYRPPSAPAIGAANSEELSREVGQSVGGALKALGVNINLAPVLDVPADIRSSPMAMRSFSSDSIAVARLGTAYIRGLKDAGVLATAKHFPGIGRAIKDSHRGIIRIKWKDPDERDNDTMPFRTAVQEGVDIIMMGHFIAEPGDAANLVSLSPYWMNEVLRENMGFKGLILVDNIEMKAIKEAMPIQEAAVRSFQSGADIIMVSHEKRNQEKVFNALLDAVRKGVVSRQRLNESLTRIIQAKLRIAKYREGVFKSSLEQVGRSVAEASITYLRTKESTPLVFEKETSVLYLGYNHVLFKELQNFAGYAEQLNTTLHNYGKIKPDTPITEFIKKFGVVIMDAGYTDAGEIISLCNNLNKEYVVILGLPGRFQETIDRLRPRRLLLFFENTTIHLRVALEIMSGMRQAKGRLPYNFTLPENYIYN